VDQIFTLRQISEKAWEFNRDIHLIFLDCIKAFDSIHRETLLGILKEFQFPTKLINLISMCISETFAKIKTPNLISQQFQIHSGLTQGDPLSPVFFDLVLEKIDREMQKNISEKGFRMENTKLDRSCPSRKE
jgi:Reverse transcriptase (RNA-dependent DNA polymerase).